MITIKNGRELFLLRSRQSILKKMNIWKTALDWTVWLYIIIPIVLVFIYHYQKLWTGVSEWVYLINAHVIIILFFITLTFVSLLTMTYLNAIVLSFSFVMFCCTSILLHRKSVTTFNFEKEEIGKRRLTIVGAIGLIVSPYWLK